jgi:GABA(A) receptor-associated protein
LPFKSRLTLSQRKKEYGRIQQRIGENIPIILNNGSRDTPKMEKEKFIVPTTMTTTVLCHVIRKKMKDLLPSSALFLFCESKILSPNIPLKEVYEKYKSEDNFLYITYTTENVFG